MGRSRAQKSGVWASASSLSTYVTWAKPLSLFFFFSINFGYSFFNLKIYGFILSLGTL